ncbi:MAG: hypothetical protein KJ950_01810 [Proteobacteria bacterium]|nr:hypothetical protein [Pseudomonadota bacterium]MBU1688235.1 hypothetical protein [Pseudomonadota bacterium]
MYNILFLAFCGGIFLFLWNAPPESTAFLPHDSDHERFFAMEKKAAEKFCLDCHNPDGQLPLPEGHPPKYRCLFCHKKTG